MGTVRQRGDKYQAIVKRQNFGSTSKTFTLEKDALAWVQEKEAAMDRGEPLTMSEPAKFTLAEGLARYRDTITPTKKGANIEFYRINRWLADPLSKRPIAELSPMDFASWRNAYFSLCPASTCYRKL